MPTFSRDIAPLIFGHCSTCHRPGQAAPFSLLTYSDAKKHARNIADVTQRRYMPPWLPVAGYGDFTHNRSLSEVQIALFRDWFQGGSPEGSPKDLPPRPVFAEGWQLGTPDLIVSPAEAFTVPAEGKDVYRNLVFPIPMNASRYVRGVEFHPGNSVVLHHAFVNIDETRHSRRLAERQSPAGFDGMDVPPPANMPAGQFLGWQPGRLPSFAPPGLAWLLRTNTDMVLQLHLHPTGKTETIKPSIGFYFTDQPPTNTPLRIALVSYELDIPAGETNYLTQDSYRLPVDVQILRVETHAHYLAKQMQAWAILPNGKKEWLIWIKDWDFNWQGGYDYVEPIHLPAGTQLFMNYSYDNSADNPRNPNRPPKRVRFGLQTTDEMGELWLQTLVPNAQDRATLVNDYFAFLARKSAHYNQFRLQLDPNDAVAHVRVGHDLLVAGRVADAAGEFQKAIQIQPKNAQAHHEMALVYLSANQLEEAAAELSAATALDPYDSEGFGNLGFIYLRTGRPEKARLALQQALKIDPDDSVAANLLKGLPPSQ